MNNKFKITSNQTPNEHIINVRLGKAADLLLEGEMNVSEIAFKVGFSEPTNFARAFTKVYGKSPKKYISNISNRPK